MPLLHCVFVNVCVVLTHIVGEELNAQNNNQTKEQE